MNALGFDPSKLSNLQIPQFGASPYGVMPRQAEPVVPQSVVGAGNSRFNGFNPDANFAGLGVKPLVPQLNSLHQMNASACAGCAGGSLNLMG
jgi:hypothetical protein